MNQQPPYLEKYTGPASRYRCPGCGKPRELARYMDAVTGEYIADHVGRCNRQDRCGYHYTPAQHFADTKPIDAGSPYQPQQRTQPRRPQQPIQRPIQEPATIPAEIFRQSLQPGKTVEQIAAVNTFVQYLLTLFPVDVVAALVSRFFIGSSGKRWPGAAVFWFIPAAGRIAAGQVKVFDGTGHTASFINGEGNKKKCTTWMHSIIEYACKKQAQPLPEWLQSYIDAENKISCLYGEHLLNKPQNRHKVVALCEAPKTAIIASVYLPQFVWVACGALEWFSADRCQALKGRHVALFPDLSKVGSAYTKWAAKAKELAHIATFTLSDLLERKATDAERAEGLDLADYLTRYDYRQFTTTQPVTIEAVRPSIDVQAFEHQDSLHFVTYLTSSGNYDILFTKDARPVQQRTDEVQQIETFYNKVFQPAMIDGEPCLVHRLN